MARAISGRDGVTLVIEFGGEDSLPQSLRAVRAGGTLAMNRAIESGGLRPVIDRVFAFEELHEALDYLKSGQHFGKVCIQHRAPCRLTREPQACTASMLAMPVPAAW